MKSICLSVGVGCVVALLSLAPVAGAENPPDPHQPDMTRNYCPGGTWGFGRLKICDGEKYADGSYWHQWLNERNFAGPTFHYDCVGDSGNNIMPAPPPPGGCEGAIPLEPPPGDAPPPGDPAPPPGQPPG